MTTTEMKGPDTYSDAVGTHFLFPILFEFWNAISLLIQSLPLPLQHLTNVKPRFSIENSPIQCANYITEVAPHSTSRVSYFATADNL